MTPTDFIVVYITVPSLEVGNDLARLMVEQKLAACVNVIPGVISHYKWQDELHQDNEALLMAKTTRHRLEKLTEQVREHHPYELPEVIALPIIGGLGEYLDWIKENIK